MHFDQSSLFRREVWFPPCFVTQNQQKSIFFCAAILDHFQQQQKIKIWDNFFPLLFPKDSESLKFLDIQLREVGAKNI